MATNKSEEELVVTVDSKNGMHNRLYSLANNFNHRDEIPRKMQANINLTKDIFTDEYT